MAASYFDPQAGSRELRRKAHAEFARQPDPATPRVQGGRKCESCGSREYVLHCGTSICSYCRTPGEAPALGAEDKSSYQGSLDNYLRANSAICRSSVGGLSDNAAGYAYLMASMWSGK